MANISGANAADSVKAYAYSTSTNSSDNSMGMQEFLMLVVAQLQNQDINSGSTDNGQFMSQMAQVASMQAMQELSASFMSSMAVNFIGKYVHAEATVTIPATSANESDTTEFVTKEGLVERVNFNGGDAVVLVDGVWFKMRDIYELATPTAVPEVSGDDEEGSSGDPVTNKEESGDEGNNTPLPEAPYVNTSSAAATRMLLDPGYYSPQVGNSSSASSADNEDTDIPAINNDGDDITVSNPDVDGDENIDVDVEDPDPLAPLTPPDEEIEAGDDQETDTEVSPAEEPEL